MRRRGRVASVALTAALIMGATTACQLPSGANGGATGGPDVPDAISDHEAGPESPIVPGLTVPTGAVQLGPLTKVRSDRLIAAYQPDLAVALTRQGVQDARSALSGNPTGELAATPPTITKNGRPDDDSYALLEEPPPADITVSLMRLDTDKVQAVESMVTQIADLLPDAGVNPADVASFCTVVDVRITDCALQAQGTTEDGRRLSITMAVDPGNVDTRVSAPSTLTNPVMELRIENLSDPRVAQTMPPPPADEEAPTDETVGGKEASPEFVFPAMDLEAPADTPLLNGWVAPDDVTILLSSFTPSFVTLHVSSAAQSREIARNFAASLAPGVTVRTDSYEGLNEVNVTFTATAPDGSRAVATHIITARGNYVTLLYTPPA